MRCKRGKRVIKELAYIDIYLYTELRLIKSYKRGKRDHLS